MKKSLNILALLFIINLFSCKCGDISTCPTLSDSAQSWLNLSDTIKFINSTGSKITLVVSSKAFSEPYQIDLCSPNGLGGCVCDYKSCESSGNFLAISDTTISDKNEYFVRIDEIGKTKRYEAELKLNYTIFDFQKTINLLKPNELSTNDSLITSLIVGNNTYSSVYVHMIDTTIASTLNRKIWKVYYTQLNGIVGFRTRQNQNFYYRE